MSFDEKDTLARAMELSQSQRRMIDPFRATPIQPGMALFVDFKFGNARAKASSQLVGYIQGEYIILQTPKINGAFTNYAGQKEVVVRYLLNGCIYGFKVAIIRMLSSPLNLTFLKYPDQIEEISLRKSPRVQVVIPLEREGGDPTKEWMLNLSTNGGLFQLAGHVRIDEKINVSFTLPDGERVEKLGCIIRRLDASSSRITAGVQFDHKHPDFPKISSYLSIVMETLGLDQEDQDASPKTLE